MGKMSEEELVARDNKRDLGTELLQAICDLQAGHYGRRSIVETDADGTLRRWVAGQSATELPLRLRSSAALTTAETAPRS